MVVEVCLYKTDTGRSRGSGRGCGLQMAYVRNCAASIQFRPETQLDNKERQGKNIKRKGPGRRTIEHERTIIDSNLK